MTYQNTLKLKYFILIKKNKISIKIKLTYKQAVTLLSVLFSFNEIEAHH